MIGKFFYLPKAKKFTIKPRYYDPEQEERDAREKRIKGELGIADDQPRKSNYRDNIRGSFRYVADDKSKTANDARKSSNVRLILMIVILSLIFYLFFYSNLIK